MSHAIRLTLTLILGLSTARAQSIAFTFDDGPRAEPGAVLDEKARNAALLGHLARHQVKSALFLTLETFTPERRPLVEAWGRAGHRIANHTATHQSLESLSLEAFQADMQACDRVIRTLPGFAPWFRFPYLKEGDTREKRDGFRAFLAAMQYQPAGVSVDASDWAYNQRLLARLKRRPKADLEPFRRAYLAHIWDRATYYDGLSRQVLGRSASHVLLLHHNELNAHFLGDLIQMFKARGWTVIDAEQAFGDPLYRMLPDTLPAGESLLWSLARAKGTPGLRYPAEDDRYEKAAFRKAGI